MKPAPAPDALLEFHHPRSTERSIVLLSGGQDSSTVAYLAARQTTLVAAVHVQYHQRHEQELQAAQAVADDLSIPLHVLSFDALAQIGDSALVSEGDVNANHANPRARHLPASFVPGRNLLLITLAAAVGYRLDASLLYVGTNATDYSGYPDCRWTALDPLEVAIRAGLDWASFTLHAPLMPHTKAETFALAERLGVLEQVLRLSRTCYEGSTDEHAWGLGCGACPACKLREAGWREYTEQRVRGAQTA